MNIAVANLQNLLRSLPPNAPPTVARNIETAVQLSGRFSEKAAEVRSNTRLSAEGKTEQVRAVLSGGFSGHFAQLRSEIDSALAGIAGEIGNLKKRAVELLTDGFSPELRREVRDRLQMLPPNDRRRLALESDDRLIQASILEASAFLTGLDPQVHAAVEQRLVEGMFGKRLGELEVDHKAWEHADAVCKIVANELSKEAEVNAADLLAA